MAFEKVIKLRKHKWPEDMAVDEIVMRGKICAGHKSKLMRLIYRAIEEKGMEFSLDQDDGNFVIRRDK